MITRTKGHIVEKWNGGILDRRAFKVHGEMYTTGLGTSYTRTHRIPPRLLITVDERLQSIGTQLELLLDSIA